MPHVPGLLFVGRDGPEAIDAKKVTAAGTGARPATGLTGHAGRVPGGVEGIASAEGEAGERAAGVQNHQTHFAIVEFERGQRLKLRRCLRHQYERHQKKKSKFHAVSVSFALLAFGHAFGE